MTASPLAYLPGPAPAHGGALLLDAEIAPNRSLSARAFLVMVTAVAATIAGLSLLYLALGAWPVVGFLGADVLLVLGAFWLSYRQGRAREFVRVSRGHVTVERRGPSGRAHHLAADPWRVRVDVVRPGKHDVAVVLRSLGGAVRIAAALSPPEREAFADALRRALAAAQETGGRGRETAPETEPRPDLPLSTRP